MTARRTLAALLTAAAVALGGTVLLGAPAAQADSLGTLTATPATGTDVTPMSLKTSGTCPEPADYLIVSVTGAGFPAEGQNVVGNSPLSIYPSTGSGYEVPLTETMRDYASTAGFKTLQGRYEFTVTCRRAFGSATYGDFKGSVWFTSNTAYQSTAPAVATTASLALSPAGSSVQGSAVTFTAKITPSTATGTVRFYDGTSLYGPSVTVTKGTAAFTSTVLAAGTHSLKAKFTPANPANHTASTSAAVPYTVKLRPPTVTTAPKVTGTVRVGSKVTCSVKFGGATTVRHQWLRDGKAITGATASTRVLDAADRTHKVSCRPSGVNSGGTTTVTSPALTVATGPALRATTAPAISGTAKVGKKLTAKAGIWTPAAQSYTYVWKRDGKAISGATKSTYTAVKADKGHKLSLTVTAKRAGFANGVSTSKSVTVS